MMKALVLGALFLRTLNAQDIPATGSLAVDDSPAPLLIPNENAPTEAKVLAGTNAGASGVTFPQLPPVLNASDVQFGSNDVIIELSGTPEASSSASPASSSTIIAFGAGTTAGPGVSFNGTGFNWPALDTDTDGGASPDDAGAEPVEEEDPGAEADPNAEADTDIVLPPSPSEDPASPFFGPLLPDVGSSGASADSDPDADVDEDGDLEDFNLPVFGGSSPDGETGASGQSSDEGDDSEAGPVSHPPFSGFNFTFSNSTPAQGAAAAGTGAAPASLPTPAPVDEPEEPEPEESEPEESEPIPIDEPVKPTRTPPAFSGPGWYGPDGKGPAQPLPQKTPAAESPESFDPSAIAGLFPSGVLPPVLAPAASDAAGVGALASGESDAQDGGSGSSQDDDNYDGQDLGDGDDYTDDEGDDDDYIGDEGDDYEGDDEECPSYCLDDDDEDPYFNFTSKLRRRQAPPSSGGGFVTFSFPSGGQRELEDCDEDLPEWMFRSMRKRQLPCRPKCPDSCYAGPEPEPPAPSGPSNYSSSVPYPTPTPYITPSAPATTPTTLVTIAGPSGPAPSYTGDMLASICPRTCDPSPLYNKCDVTTSCTATGGGRLYCACRAGFRSSAWNEKDFSKQFKVPGQPFVYTSQGVVCDELCSDQTCSEVLERPLCA